MNAARGLWLVLLALALGTAARADEPITSATPDIIRFLREDALRDRAQADHQTDRAGQWRGLEASARRQAEQSRDPADRQSWLDQAALYDRYARELEADAATLRAKADTAEARAGRLRAALDAATPPAVPSAASAVPSASTASPAPATTPATTPAEPGRDHVAYRVEDVLGFWQTRDAPAVDLALVAERGRDGKATARLTAHTARRQWQGTFTDAASGPIVRLTYTPKPEEMNPEMPEWVRRAAAGKLVWRIELTPEGENFDFFFKGKWFSGEVTWDARSNDPASVEIADEKTPWEFELELNHGIAIAALELPTIALVPGADADHDAASWPMDTLTMGQLFSPRVTLPAGMAKAAGDTLAVDVKATKSGGSEQVVLKRRGIVGSGPVTYMPDQPVLIADDCSALGEARRNPPTLSWKWIRERVARDRAGSGDSVFWTWVAGDDPGPCLELAAETGEAISFRHEEAFFVARLYPSWVQSGLARHKTSLARLRAGFRSVVEGATPGNAAAAAKRLSMLDNYERLIAVEHLTDIHRFNLGELYLGDTADRGAAIVLETDDGLYQAVQNIPRERPQGTFLNPLMKAFLEGLTGSDLTPRATSAATDIKWTSGHEEILVRDVLWRTSDEIATGLVREYVKNFSFGAYEGYAVATPGGRAWIVATGTDHRGNRVTGWERFFTAVGLGSEAVLTIAGAHMEVESTFRQALGSGTLGKGLQTESTLMASAARGAEEAAKGATFQGVPRSLPAADLERLMLKAAPDGDRPGAPVSCGRADKVPVRTLMELPPQPGAPLSAAAQARKAEALRYMRAFYGPDAKLVGEFKEMPDLPLQDGPTCQAGAANRLVYNAKGVVRTSTETRRKMLTIMREQIVEFDMQPGGVSFGRRARQGNRKISDFLSAPGFKTGFDNLATRDFLRSEGANVTEILPDANAGVKLRHIWSALQQGYGVKVVVDFAKRTGSSTKELHAIVVEKVNGTVSRGRTNITSLEVYDSNIGQLIEIPARDFDRVLARDWADGGILTLVRFPPRR